jgi:hypothetical protein
MNITEIKELYYAEPFEPFEIVLTNGSTVRVAHPEFISFSPDRKTVTAYDLRGGGAKRIDVKLITVLNELPPAPRRKHHK